MQIIICGWLIYNERGDKYKDYGFVPIDLALFDDDHRKGLEVVTGFFQGYVVRRSNQLFLSSSEKMALANEKFFHAFSVRIWIPPEKFNRSCENSYVVVSGNLHNYSGLLAIDDVLTVVGFEDDLDCYSADQGVINFYERGFGANH